MFYRRIKKTLSKHRYKEKNFLAGKFKQAKVKANSCATHNNLSFPPRTNMDPAPGITAPRRKM